MASNRTFRWCDPEDDHVGDFDDTSTLSSVSADMAAELRAARLEASRCVAELAAVERGYRRANSDLAAEHFAAARLRLEVEDAQRQSERHAAIAQEFRDELGSQESCLHNVCARQARALRAAAMAVGAGAPADVPGSAGIRDVQWVDSTLSSVVDFFLASRPSASYPSGVGASTREERHGQHVSHPSSGSRATVGRGVSPSPVGRSASGIPPRRHQRTPTPPGIGKTVNPRKPSRSSSRSRRRPHTVLVDDSPPRRGPSDSLQRDCASVEARECNGSVGLVLPSSTEERGRLSSSSLAASGQVIPASGTFEEPSPNKNAIMEISCLQHELLEARELLHERRTEQSEHTAEQLRREISAERHRCKSEIAAVQEACRQAMSRAEESHVERESSLRASLAARVEEVTVASKGSESVLRTELNAECSAMRRACHHAEERQWRHQALLEHAKQQVEKWETEWQDFRRSTKTWEGVVEHRFAEQSRRFEACEQELQAEREELRFVIRSQLAELAPQRKRLWPATQHVSSSARLHQ